MLEHWKGFNKVIQALIKACIGSCLSNDTAHVVAIEYVHAHEKPRKMRRLKQPYCKVVGQIFPQYPKKQRFDNSGNFPLEISCGLDVQVPSGVKFSSCT